MQASCRRFINQGVIGQLWPPRLQSVEHILLLLGLLTRTNWRGGRGEDGKRRERDRERETKSLEDEKVKDGGKRGRGYYIEGKKRTGDKRKGKREARRKKRE